MRSRRSRSVLVLAVAGGMLAAGIAPSSAATKAPAKPSGVTVELDSKQVAVSWTAGRYAKKYTVKAVPSSGTVAAKKKGTRTCTTKTTTCTVTKLTNGRKYNISVVSKNGKLSSKAVTVKSVKPNVAASTVTITGYLATTGGPVANIKVVAIQPSGAMYESGLTGADGVFTVAAMPGVNADVRNTSLQMVDSRGGYLGPIIFNARGVTGLGNQTIDTAVLNVGRVTVADNHSWGKVAVTPRSLGSAKTSLSNGRPVGAGYAGYVPVAVGAKTRSAVAVLSGSHGLTIHYATMADCSALSGPGDLPGSACWDWISGVGGLAPCFGMSLPLGTNMDTWISDPAHSACAAAIMSMGGGGGDGGGGSADCSSVNPGADDDADGIPNAVDVDDNGDGVVDMADPNENNACTVEPTKGIRTELGTGTPLNYGDVVYNGRSKANFEKRVNKVLSTKDFGIGYYVYDTHFLPGAYMDADGVIPAVWVDCPGVGWCDPATSKALNFTNIEQSNAHPDAMQSPLPEQCSEGGMFAYYCNTAFDSLVGHPTASPSPATTGSSECANYSNGETTSYYMPCWKELTKPLQWGSLDTNCMGVDGAGPLYFNPDYDPASTYTALSGKTNFLWQTLCKESSGDGGTHERQVLGASLVPNLSAMGLGVSAAAYLSATDILTLSYLTSSDGSTTGSIATTLGAYPITVPMVKKITMLNSDTGDVAMPMDYVNGSSNPNAKLWGGNPQNGGEQRALILGPGDKLQIEFYRPQRPAFQGETSTTGYHDLHGLNYGLEIESGSYLYGCGESSSSTGGDMPDALSNYPTSDGANSDFAASTSSDGGAKALAPLKDTVAADSASEEPASSTITMTLDLSQCFVDRFQWLKDQSGYGDISLSDFEVGNSYNQDGTATNWMDDTWANDHNLVAPHGGRTCLPMSLTARGEARTGGTDSGRVDLCVQFKSGTFDGMTPTPLP